MISKALLSEIKNNLFDLGADPKKSLGQNFLVNPLVYESIVYHLDPQPDETIVEIGPGLGTLTRHLAAKSSKIIAVEKDSAFVSHLRKKYPNNGNVSIIEDDILRWSPPAVFSSAASLSTHHSPLITSGYSVVGNLPYYLSSHLLRIIFEAWPMPRRLVFMLQLEVAQRITRRPPNMSMLSVLCQYYCTVRIAQKVPSGDFYPRPKVNSAIAVFDPLPPRLTDPERIQFFKLASAGFSQNRKQLVNNLSRELKIDRKTVLEKFTQAGFDPRRRAETLTIEDWVSLLRYF